VVELDSLRGLAPTLHHIGQASRNVSQRRDGRSVVRIDMIRFVQIPGKFVCVLYEMLTQSLSDTLVAGYHVS
jgi:hypothetical protein